MGHGEVSTLVEKECGHVGIVRSFCPDGSIACSQCESTGRSSLVGIVNRVEVPAASVPEMDVASMESWIRRMLGGSRGR
jgi:hypothetical protein